MNHFDVNHERESDELTSRLGEPAEGRATILIILCRTDFDLAG